MQLENNVWIVGDDEQVLVIDAAHEPDLIAEAVGDRRLVGIVCTRAHSGHVDAAVELSELTAAPILPHRDDLRLWHDIYPDRTPDDDLTDGRQIDVAGTELTVGHTPGHTPGSVTPRRAPPHVPGLRRVRRDHADQPHRAGRRPRRDGSGDGRWSGTAGPVGAQGAVVPPPASGWATSARV
ncbi:MBL fold metallo-hydrolase [Streptomyces sp. TP-A0356]|uniref:MBL fold metallo-hydrolase n=1 Tax=Streptomyces sp. TP-A0356 TaxID=1359208 RepID=UPI0006E306D8|nr:MBL fold metallo-hydrolase [Streptomyces sp. TP-A0356]